MRRLAAEGTTVFVSSHILSELAEMCTSLCVMNRGRLLAYLMADHELSLQSILIISAIIGRRKAWTYVGFVALFSTAAGLTYGAWIDGTPLVALASGVGQASLATDSHLPADKGTETDRTAVHGARQGLTATSPPTRGLKPPRAANARGRHRPDSHLPADKGTETPIGTSER
mgnify:CR=1 FL=1